MLRCRNCGGNLVFDIKQQSVKCIYCSSVFDPAEYSNDKGAEETTLRDEEEGYETILYTCTQCGAEIISPAQAAVGFCSFCGTEAVLESRISNEKRPAKIIPFKVTKEDCKKAYQAAVSKEMLVPREFKDESFIERFRGIYIPYWNYSMGFQKDPVFEVTSTYNKGNYTYTDTYNIRAGLPAYKPDIPFDSSIGFDDELAAAIAPYNTDDMVPFNPAYLAGFFADTSDASSELYEQEAVRKAQDKVIDNLKEGLEGSVKVKLPDDTDARQEIMGTTIEERTSGLCPVWFLTWRRGERLAYAVINGETGKVFAEIPIDIRAFFVRILLTAVILFLVLSFAGVLILPMTGLMISAFIAFVTQLIFRKEIMAIRDREKGYYNIGSVTGESETTIKRFLKARNKERGGAGSAVLSIVSKILALTIIGGFMSGQPNENITMFVAAAGLVAFLVSLKPALEARDKDMLVFSLFPLLSEIAAVGLILAKPVHDWVYYCGSAVCMLAVVVTACNMILRYNRLCTRGVPDFHDRKGGAGYEAG